MPPDPAEASGTQTCRFQALRAPCQADRMSVSEDRIRASVRGAAGGKNQPDLVAFDFETEKEKIPGSH